MALKKPQIIVLPADENDSMALADVEQLAFDGPSPYALARNKKATTTCGSNDENKDDKEQPISHGRIMFGPPSEEKQKIRMEKLNERLKAVPRDYYIYKAILKTETEPAEGETETEEKKGEDKIVGFAAWRFCADQPFPAENDWQDSEWEGCASPQALNDLFGAFAKLRVEFFGGKNVACKFFLSLARARAFLSTCLVTDFSKMNECSARNLGSPSLSSGSRSRHQNASTRA